MSEHRVCRRCKKRRLDDEAPEMAKYKTCTPCRVTERKSKRVKKAMGRSLDGSYLTTTDSPEETPQSACDICGRMRPSNDNGRYKMCASCLVDPTSNPNVESDYAEYLRKLSQNKTEDVSNLIYYKHLVPPSVPVHAAAPEAVLAELTQRFIYPISHVTGFQFSRKTSNLLGKVAPVIKALYKCKQDARGPVPPFGVEETTKTLYRSLRTSECHSKVLVTYNLQTLLLVIKYTHRTHSSFLSKNYSNELIAIILESFSNGSTASNILTELQKRADNSDPLVYGEAELGLEIRAIKKATFLRDFSRENILWESHLRSGEFILPMGIDDYPTFGHATTELADNLAGLNADLTYLSQPLELQMSNAVELNIGKLVAQYGDFSNLKDDFASELKDEIRGLKHNLDLMKQGINDQDIDPGLAGLESSSLSANDHSHMAALVHGLEPDESLESRLKAGMMAVIDPHIGE